MSLDQVLHAIFTTVFAASILRVATPIILPAMGGLISDLAGSINISLEGTMLVAAFTGVIVSAYTQNVWLGLITAVIASLAFALLLAFFHLNLKADLILAGIALNILASGGTVFILYLLTGDKGNSSKLASLTMPYIDIPLIKDVPLLGPILSGQNLMVYVAFIMTALVWVFLYRTTTGFHLRAVGQNAEAAASVGVNVLRTRYLAILLSGFLAGLGGVHLGMGYLQLFQRDMAAGRGFIALAAVYLGGRNPVGTLLAALVFGAFDALSNQLGSLNIPPQAVQMIPYAATVLALVLYAIAHRRSVIQRQKRFLAKSEMYPMRKSV